MSHPITCMNTIHGGQRQWFIKSIESCVLVQHLLFERPTHDSDEVNDDYPNYEQLSSIRIC